MPANPGSQSAVPTNPRRITRRGLVRREQILESAKTLFLANGYAGVSVDEIVKVVGGSKTNVYSQFGGKEGLFSAAVESLCEDFLVDLKRLRLSEYPLEKALTLFAKTLLKTLLNEQHVAFQRLIIAESGRFPELSQIWFKYGPQQSRQIIADLVGFHQKNDKSNSLSTMSAAVLFHDMVVTNPVVYLATLGLPHSLRTVNQHIDDAVKCFLYGIAK